VIPAAAIQRGPQGTYVFVAKADNTADIRPVTVAFTQDNLANIASGLSPAEVVVTDGQDKLQAGSKIEIRQQARPSGSPQPTPSSAPSGKPGSGTPTS
jgi:multidrug efflux system membrane fusion protein